MCAVVGYIGKNMCRETVMEGLSRLEYRGYDSSGFACFSPEHNRILYLKTSGSLQNLKQALDHKPIDGYMGIGHTRWSTHGISSEQNAHPQFDCHLRISVVHNGIVENYHYLKQMLVAQGHTFCSDTDTEVIAHLLEYALGIWSNLYDALLYVVQQLQGALTCIAIAQDYPHAVMMVRKKSPLCIGIADQGIYIASDALAFAGDAKKVLFLPDESFGYLTLSEIQMYDFQGRPLPLQFHDAHSYWLPEQKGAYEHFMLKEIYDQKQAIEKTINFLQHITAHIWDYMNVTAAQIEQLEKIHIVGCGTSWHAGLIAQFFFESISRIPTHVHLASEFRYMPFFPEKNTVYIFISQSGETADTLEALRMVRSYHIPTVALTNIASSTIVREADGFLLTQAGIEVAVASTKAFSTQVAALYWLAHRIAYEKKYIEHGDMQQMQQQLLITAELLENSIQNYQQSICQQYAPAYAAYTQWIFLGRHISYPFALEAALKLKEISYVFAQCYPAGELKHGALALVDQGTPILLFSHADDRIYQKLLSNAQEVKARHGHLVSFVFEHQKELIDLSDTTFILPAGEPLLGPLTMTGLMQLFIYYLAKERGCAIDKPRNLAKSVTVE